jgi:hypothetical protein
MDELVCYACDRRFGLDDRARCTCGEPLWIDVDATGLPVSSNCEFRSVADVP